MNERPIPAPRHDADPGHEDEVELTRLGAVVEETGASGPITVFDRADRLEVEHPRRPLDEEARGDDGG